MLKLKETCRLSQAAIDDVVEGTRMVFSKPFRDYTVVSMQNWLLLVLMTDIVFADLTDLFVDLETQHKQDKYFVEDLGLIVSAKYL